MVSNDFEFEGKQQNDDMVKLIETKIVKNIDPIYQYNNKFWIKNSDDNKPYFKYEENKKIINNHSNNKGSKLTIPVVKDKFKINLPARQSIRNSLSFNHTFLSDCKCKLRAKKNVNKDDETLKRNEKSPKINKNIQQLVKRNLNQNEIGKIKSSNNHFEYDFKQIKTAAMKRVNIPSTVSKKEKMITQSCCCGKILNLEKKFTKSLKTDCSNYSSSCKYIDFNHDINIISSKSDNLELLTNEKLPSKDKLVDFSSTYLGEDKNHDYELEEFERFEYFSKLSNNLNKVTFF
jgi:hypothetical protein